MTCVIIIFLSAHGDQRIPQIHEGKDLLNLFGKISLFGSNTIKPLLCDTEMPS